MKRIGIIIAASLGLAAGSVVAQMPQLLGSRAYAAPAAAAPTKYEYICVDVTGGLANELNQRAKDGWELVGITSKSQGGTTTAFVGCLKRAVVPGQ